MEISNRLEGRRSLADVALVAAGGVGAGMAAAYWGIGGVASRPVRPFASPFVVSQVRTRRPAVALTFDDGPDPNFTARRRRSARWRASVVLRTRRPDPAVALARARHLRRRP